VAVNIVEKVEDRIPIRNVIVSVSDKNGLDVFIPALVETCPGVRFFSTGGTYKALETLLGSDRERLTAVSDYTGQPEMQGGLVKTLDFKIYLGLLSESFNDAHDADLERAGALRFDMTIVNLYPFRETVSKPGVTLEAARANIDIGGPCMVRASAKNFLRVAVVTDPADYGEVASALREGKGALNLATRYALAKKAFSHTADYDGMIREFLEGTEFTSARECYPSTS
jgi:phosphoribosylaminoimidazolecarboxamide formyltransferase/IMP cyclohydrolase